MKIFAPVVILAALLPISLPARAETPIINLSVGGQVSPGVYGQVQFGNAPPPPVFYPQPTIIVQPPAGRLLEPIYMNVPPGHAKNWARYCRRYNACDRPVYFVRSAEYEPGYRRHRDEGRRGEGHPDEGRRNEGRGDNGRRDDHGDRGDRGDNGDHRD